LQLSLMNVDCIGRAVVTASNYVVDAVFSHTKNIGSL